MAKVVSTWVRLDGTEWNCLEFDDAKSLELYIVMAVGDALTRKFPEGDREFGSALVEVVVTL